MKVSKDPIELLKAIKEEALSYQDNKYPAAIVLNALTNLLTCKQQHGESLQDYTSRFKNYRDVLMSQMGGPIVIQKMVEVDPSFTAAAAKNQDKLKDIQTKTYKEFLAHMYLHNSDHTKYGTLLTTLSTLHSLGNDDQYPKTITEANSVLSSHKFDATY